MESILIIEDNRPLQRALRRLFASDGLAVHVASDGPEGLALFEQKRPSAVVLDLKLPHLPGKELCRAFKSQQSSIPVIVLSANTEIEDKVLLLELGADDYVTKPFSPKELLARVRRAMRRQAPPPVMQPAEGTGLEILHIGDARVDFTRMEAMRQRAVLELTAHEFKILKFFALHPYRVFSRDELLNKIWGYESYPSTRTVDNYMARLRQKFEPDPAHPRYFLTVHGAGYKFAPEAHGPAAGS